MRTIILLVSILLVFIGCSKEKEIASTNDVNLSADTPEFISKTSFLYTGNSVYSKYLETNVDNVVAYFSSKQDANERSIKAHNDFTDFYSITLLGIGYFSNAKLVMITDSGTYSTANSFVSIMKNFANILIIGGKTGGGGATSSEGVLPNGWLYSISVDPKFDINHLSLENSIEPDYQVEFGQAEAELYHQTKIHSQMEYAFSILNK